MLYSTCIVRAVLCAATATAFFFSEPREPVIAKASAFTDPKQDVKNILMILLPDKGGHKHLNKSEIRKLFSKKPFRDYRNSMKRLFVTFDKIRHHQIDQKEFAKALCHSGVKS